MSRSWPSRQSTIEYHGVSTSADSSFHQTPTFSVYSRRKIELINLTKDSGSECNPSNITYHTYPSPIITTGSECIKLSNVRKFGFTYLAVRQLLYKQKSRSFRYQLEYNPYGCQALPAIEYEKYTLASQVQDLSSHVSWTIGNIKQEFGPYSLPSNIKQR